MSNEFGYDRISFLLRKLLPNFRFVTTRIYYSQIYKLAEYLDKNSWQCENYIIFCKMCVNNEVRRIAKYFNVQYLISSELPEDVVIIICDKRAIEPKINY